jgi:hypothetical protein
VDDIDPIERDVVNAKESLPLVLPTAEIEF